MKPKKTQFSLVISIFLHGLFLTVAIMTPLFFTDTLNSQQVVTYLVAPPPPPTATPACGGGQSNEADESCAAGDRHLTSPVSVPKVVAMIVDEGPPPDIAATGGVVGGVPGGVPGGTVGGVLAGVPGGALSAAPLAPPPPVLKVEAPKIKTPVRVGRKVKPPHLEDGANPFILLWPKQPEFKAR